MCKIARIHPPNVKDYTFTNNFYTTVCCAKYELCIIRTSMEKKVQEWMVVLSTGSSKPHWGVVKLLV